MTASTTSDQSKPAKATKATKAAAKCQVADCSRKPKNRGLCLAHWQTHRGLASPKEDSPR